MSDLNFLDTSGNKQTITVPALNSMAFNTANTERLRINSSGAVMINTTNSSSRTLNLKGTFGILSTSQTGVLDMSVTDGGVASIAPYVAGGSELVFKTNASGSGVSEKMRISSSGAVTKPNHPSFRINRTVNNNYTSTTLNEILPWDVVEWDKTNVSGYGYDTSTYKYRVAVAGVYWFHCAVYTDTNIEVMFDIVKNSAGNYIQRAELRQSGSDDIGNNSIVHCAGLSQCAVGDYIYVVNSGGNAIELIGGNAEGYVDFSGYLIG